MSQYIIDALVRRIDNLSERLAAIEDGFSWDLEPYRKIGLSGTEAAIVSILMKRESVTPQGLLLMVYGTADDIPSPKILDVWLCKIRKKLKPLKVRVYRVHDGPISITDDGKDKLRAALQSIGSLPRRSE